MKVPTKPNRQQKIEALLALRKNWTIEDFEDSYSDDFNWKTERSQTIYEWRQYMHDLLYHAYDEALIDECLDNEVYEYKILKTNTTK